MATTQTPKWTTQSPTGVQNKKPTVELSAAQSSDLSCRGPPGVPCPAGGDAGHHQAAGGGPVSSPAPQRPLRVGAQGLQADQRGPEEEGRGVPAEDPEGKDPGGGLLSERAT